MGNFSRFFIERPIFASVISIIITIAGLVSSAVLPISQYPEIAPPTVTITAIYPGASAETLAKTVAAPIERHHPAVTGEVGDLTLPHPRVDDLPGREKEDGALAVAIDLVEDPYPVALHEPIDVRIARPGLFAPCGTVYVSCGSLGRAHDAPPRVDLGRPYTRGGGRPLNGTLSCRGSPRSIRG